MQTHSKVDKLFHPTNIRTLVVLYSQCCDIGWKKPHSGIIPHRGLV